MGLSQKDLLTWCDDLHQVKGNMLQLQATLNQILLKSPLIPQFRDLIGQLEAPNLDRQLLEKARNLLNSPQVKVAIRLKALYDKGLLPALLALSKINFKSAKADRFVGYFLDHNPPKDAANSLPAAIKKTVPTTEKLSPLFRNYPPILPPLSSPGLLRVVLTDKSYRSPSDYLESEIEGSFSRSHNRRLAIKGRSMLELVLLEVLESTFPDIHEDDLVYMKNRLVSNHILTKLAFSYNLVDSLYHEISQAASANDKITVFSTVFAAYIGGLSQDGYSVDEMRLWISKLYDPIVSKMFTFYTESGSLKDVHRFAYAELNFLLLRVSNVYEIPTKKIKLEFVELDEDPYAVKAVLGDSLVLGLGTSSVSFEHAKYKAAYEAIGTKKKIETIISYIFQHFKTPENQPDPAPEDDGYSPKEDTYVLGYPENAEKPVVESLEQPSEFLPPRPETSKQENEVVIPEKPDMKPLEAAIKPPPTGPRQRAPLPYTPLQRGPLPYGALPPNPNLVNQNVPQVDYAAKNNLYALLGSHHLNPIYTSLKVGNDFEITIAVNDVVLGSAHDSNKKIASQKAAMNALANKTALQQLGVVSTNGAAVNL